MGELRYLFLPRSCGIDGKYIDGVQQIAKVNWEIKEGEWSILGLGLPALLQLGNLQRRHSAQRLRAATSSETRAEITWKKR